MSYSEVLIQSAQIEALIKNEERRKKRAYKALCYYDDIQEPFLEKALRYRYPNTYTDVLPFMVTIPLSKSMVRQLAKLFQSDPAINLRGIDETSAIAEAFSKLLDECKLYQVLGQIDRICETCHQVGVLPHYDAKRDRVYLQLITPDKVTVWQNEKDPTQLDALAYPILNRENTLIAQKGNRYAFWTEDTYQEIEILMNGKIEPIPGTEAPNVYGRIPVIWFSIELPMNRFWIDSGYPIMKANETANLQLTAFNMGIDFQSFATMVTEGMPESQVITSNVSRFLNIPKDKITGTLQGKAYYINPGVNLNSIWQVINDQISLAAALLGISTDFIRGGANYSSGYQLRLSMTGVIDHNQAKRSVYRESIRELVQLIMDCKRIYGKVNLPTDADINIDYADVQVTPNQMELEQIRTLKLANGTMSIIDAIMEDNQDLDRQSAIERKKQIDSENAIYRTPNLTTGMFE